MTEAKRSPGGERPEAGSRRSVLVADGNTGRGGRLVEACVTAGFQSKLAPHGAAALEIALASRPSVIVAQLDLPLVDAVKLGEILRANPRTRSAHFVFLGEGDHLGGRGAVGDLLLAGDSRPDEIVAVIEGLFEKQGRIDSLDAASFGGAPVEGSLGQLSLADLLQSFLHQRRAGRLDLVRDPESGEPGDGDRGRILVSDGEVVQARVGEVDGEKALFRMLAWRAGRFSFETGPVDEPRVILAPTRRLLTEGLRQLEEWDRLGPQLPPLDAPLKLTVKNSELPNIVHPLTQEVLLLLELYGTVREIVDHCAFPDYQVLRTLHTLDERGIVQLGRVPMPAPAARPAARPGLFNEAQGRRLRDWLSSSAGRHGELPDPKLLIVASSPEVIPGFAKCLETLSGVSLVEAASRVGGLSGQLCSLGRVLVDESLSIDLIHLPGQPSFEAFWPVAGHGALGVIFLLGSPVGEAARRVEAVSASLGRLPRARTFHVVLLGKDDRLSADELRENLDLIDEASLFLLPIENAKDPGPLLRSLFARVTP